MQLMQSGFEGPGDDLNVPCLRCCGRDRQFQLAVVRKIIPNGCDCRFIRQAARLKNTDRDAAIFAFALDVDRSGRRRGFYGEVVAL